jgi:hypothetical protein
MMEALRTSEASVSFNMPTRRYIPEDSKLVTISRFLCAKYRGNAFCRIM